MNTPYYLAVALMTVASVPSIASRAETTQGEVRKFQIEIRVFETGGAGRPVKGVRLKCKGHGEVSELSSEAGISYVPLPPKMAPGHPIEIELDPSSSSAQEWMILDPFMGKLNVPNPAVVRYSPILLIQRKQFETGINRRLSSTSVTPSETMISIDQFDGLGSSDTAKAHRRPKRSE